MKEFRREYNFVDKQFERIEQHLSGHGYKILPSPGSTAGSCSRCIYAPETEVIVGHIGFIRESPIPLPNNICVFMQKEGARDLVRILEDFDL